VLEGIVVYVDGQRYVMPRLTMRIVKDHWPDLVKLRKLATSGTPEEQAEAVPQLAEKQMDMIAAALRRNYPGFARAALDDLEIGQLPKTFNALVSFSNFETPAEVEAQGEAVSP
jgi:hypothetical protein